MELKELLLKVEKPARYVGGEYNQPNVKKPHKISYCICFLDVYEVAMSNLGIQLIYDALNKDIDIVCERCFSPWQDMGKLLKEHNMPLMSIESSKPIKDFDIIGMSVQHELCYTNIPYMLDLAHIPYFAKDRDDQFPILVAGGCSTANPLPYMDFFDLIVIGDGEEISVEYSKIVDKYRGNKAKIISECAKIKGIFAPSLAERDEDGKIVNVVNKVIVKDLNAIEYIQNPLVPNIEVVHDRPVLELFRGCYAGCRFCQAGFFYRPIRYREKDNVIKIAKNLMIATGSHELGLSSLSTGDYDGITDIIETLYPITKENNVNLQLPSLRLDSFSKELIKSARKSSLTFAPEAGTQRLRNVINKNITDDDINDTMQKAFKEGFRTVKLYFMIGLPTETESDIDGIVEIARRVKAMYVSTTGKRDVTINVATSVFIPKPMTPFMWVAQISKDEMNTKVTRIRNGLREIKGVNYSYHGAETSQIEGVFARGDEKLNKVIVSAYQNGCVFDGWSELFKYDMWIKAFQDNGVNIQDYLKEIPTDIRLPWDFIDIGVTKSYLLKEYLKAKTEEVTVGCFQKCNGCGANQLAKCRLVGCN